MSYPSRFPIQKPPQDFVQWWEPYMFDKESGAHIGGHPAAYRVWARKDERGWTRRTYGVKSKMAFATAPYVEEYEAWKAVGSPRRVKDFASIAAPYEKQQQFWHDLKGIIGKIGQPMPKISKGDVALEQRTPKTIPDP